MKKRKKESGNFPISFWSLSSICLFHCIFVVFVFVPICAFVFSLWCSCSSRADFANSPISAFLLSWVELNWWRRTTTTLVGASISFKGFCRSQSPTNTMVQPTKLICQQTHNTDNDNNNNVDIFQSVLPFSPSPTMGRPLGAPRINTFFLGHSPNYPSADPACNFFNFTKTKLALLHI